MLVLRSFPLGNWLVLAVALLADVFEWGLYYFAVAEAAVVVDCCDGVGDFVVFPGLCVLVGSFLLGN